MLDTEGVFRLIESVPSPNADSMKLWFERLGRQEVDNIFELSDGIDKMIDYYLKKGYTLELIETRIKAIINRNKLTKTWNENDIEVALTCLGEIAIRKLAKKHKPHGLEQNKKVARMGGVAKVARDNIENKLGESVISDKNALGYKYEMIRN